MLKRVPTIKTIFSIEQLIEAIIKAWQQIYNTIPKKQSVAIIYSQWALETGQGKYCWNNNIGNTKAVDNINSIIEYCVLNNVWEIINGKKVLIPPTNPGSWFRSFSTLTDGAIFHLDFLKNHRYKKAWTAVESGNPIDFAHLLKLEKYYTAPEANYTKAIAIFFNKFMKDTTFEKIIASLETMPKTDSESTNSDCEIVTINSSYKTLFDRIKQFLYTIFNSV